MYILAQILHDWDDDRCRVILGNCCRAMRPEGKLLVVEQVLPPANEPSLGKWLDLHMLVLLTGRERSEAEYRNLLRAAGFELTKSFPPPRGEHRRRRPRVAGSTGAASFAELGTSRGGAPRRAPRGPTVLASQATAGETTEADDQDMLQVRTGWFHERSRRAVYSGLCRYTAENGNSGLVVRRRHGPRAVRQVGTTSAGRRRTALVNCAHLESHANIASAIRRTGTESDLALAPW